MSRGPKAENIADVPHTNNPPVKFIKYGSNLSLEVSVGASGGLLSSFPIFQYKQLKNMLTKTMILFKKLFYLLL